MNMQCSKEPFMSPNDRNISMDIRSTLAGTVAFVRACHRGQVRRGWEDYVEHPIRVASIVHDLYHDINVTKAALLHDVVEDCGVTLDRIRELHGDDVTKWVDLLTADGSCTNEMKIERAMRTLPTMLIKFADSIDNATVRDRDQWPDMEASVGRYKVNAFRLAEAIRPSVTSHQIERINRYLKEIGCVPVPL
jgi:(p)ppGpp synthase/HD superfamily hydrolase